jgi:drug/metabolite transporter (DMT)-like permease
MEHIGSFFAVACAFVWSVSVILFKTLDGEIHPLMLNFYKNTLGFICLVPTTYLFHSYFINLDDLGSNIYIMISGAIGISVADGLVLMALSRLGATRFAVVETVYAPTMILASVLFLGESLAVATIIGGCFILLGIITVNYTPEKSEIDRKLLIEGTLLGMLGFICMAVGVLIVKPILNKVDLMWVIELRLFSGMIGSFLLTRFLKKRHRGIVAGLRSKAPLKLFMACFLSTYVSMIMWVAAFKYADVSHASLLNQSVTFFTVVLAAIFLKERLSFRKYLGLSFAITGVLLVILQ